MRGDTLQMFVSTVEAERFDWSTGSTRDQTVITAPGDYFVTVIDTFGCLHVDSIGLNDLCPGSVFIPNVFTPSSDGINDEFLR